MTLFSRSNHARHEGLDSLDHAHDVDAVDPAPVVDRRLPYVGRWSSDARIVEEQVTISVFLEDFVREGIQRVRVGNISDYARNFASRRRIFRDGLLQNSFLDIRDNYGCAFARKRAHQGLANPSGPAGDHRYFSTEVLHFIAPLGLFRVVM